MGSKSRWLSALEIGWLLLLLLAASPLRPADYGSMFQYAGGPGTSFSFSWPDQMMSDVIAVANASTNSSSHFDPMGNRSSGCYPLIDDQNSSYNFVAVGSNKICSGSRGNNGQACTTVTLSYEKIYLAVTPPGPTLGSTLSQNTVSMELSYVFSGSKSRTWRCFPSRDERKEDVCTVYDTSLRRWYRTSITVQEQVKVVIANRNSLIASNSIGLLNVSLMEFSKTYNPQNKVDAAPYYDMGLSDPQKKKWVLDRKFFASLTCYGFQKKDCEKFDPRLRPWYFSKKQHKILIDSGNSMDAPVKAEFNRAPGTSYLNVAQEMAAEFSKTLPPEDMVNVFSFNATGAHPLNSQVKRKFHGAKNSSDLAELPPLSASIANAHIPTSNERSNLSTAILDIIPTFQLDEASSNVILVFSDGNFESLCLWPKLLAALQIRVMLYILPYNSDPDQYVLSTKPLPALLSEANGYFEMLDATSTINPLYWIQGYFSFLAPVQLDSVPGNSEWDNGYLRLLFKEASAVTVSYPAFGNDDMLIGVEGIDVHLENMTNELQMLLKQYFRQKTHDKLFQIVLKIQFCTRQIESKNHNFPSFTTHLEGSSYEKIDTSYSQIHDLSCCGTCNMTSNVFKTSSNNISKLTIPKFIFIFITFGSIVVFIVILMITWIKRENSVFFYYNRESNALIHHSESDSDEFDPNEEAIYENRNRGVVLEQPSRRGSSGIVLRIILFGVECAMKIFHAYAKNDFWIEVATLLRLNHAHIVKFYCFFRDSTILMELMDKDLYTFITNERDHDNNYNLPLEVALAIMLQIAKGMSYLHNHGIAHQDLKSPNILLKLQGQVRDYNFQVTAKVADFGNARFFDPRHPKGFVLFPNINIGTRAWRAPELFHPRKSFFARLFGMYPYVMVKPLDIYGFGIICHELIMGQVPMRAGHRPPILPSDRCPEGLVTLIEDCLQTNPLQHPEFDQICLRLLELISSLALNE